MAQRDDGVPPALGQIEHGRGGGEIGLRRAAVQKRVQEGVYALVVTIRQLGLDPPVGVGDRARVPIDEVPDVGGHMHEQPHLVRLPLRGHLDEGLPQQHPAEPIGVQQRVERHPLLGPPAREPPRRPSAAFELARPHRERAHPDPKRLVRTLPELVRGHPAVQIRRLLHLELRDQTIRQLRQPRGQYPSRPPQQRGVRGPPTGQLRFEHRTPTTRRPRTAQGARVTDGRRL